MFGKKEKQVDYSDIIRVRVIEEESPDLAEALGITEDRLEELTAKLKISMEEENTTISDTFASFNGTVKHANELIYVGFMIGQIVGKANSMELLKKMFTK